ncbi:MAG: DUF1071 domain-containing protein [Nitrosomonadales bacterium]|nr:DUF1071 domain-containing protein [Nitrosomonadales bacterium]
MKIESNYFAELAKINVNEHIERKGQFSYLSWPFAVAQLRQFDATATWEVKRFDGLPYLATDTGCYVEVSVTVRSITLSQIHPVLDSKNRPLLTPSAFDINTSIQRCLVKAIALHGLGLYIYAGEDLPDEQNDPKTPSQPSPSSPTVRQFQKPKAVSDSTEPLTVNQLRFIKKLISETGTDEEQLLGFFGFDALENIPKVEVNRVLKMLEGNRKEAA